jgi:DNA mismatch endonuclease (patch repair protein)
MADNVNPQVRSQTMKAVKSKNSKMEVKFRSTLWRLGFRFYKNVGTMPGKPDIVFPRKKIIIFLDSCFWHGCPLHLRLPSSNVEYWQAKINRNQSRDEKINNIYSEMNWRIFRIWEHELKENFDDLLQKIAKELEKKHNER